MNYLNVEVCRKCGGTCCKSMPGAFHPEDIDKPIVAEIVEKLSSGEWAIDWWEGEKPKYFLRPATTNGCKIFDPSWGGICIYLTDKGCRLEPDKRPYNCRMLEPNPNDTEGCTYHGIKDGGKYDAVLAWRTRQHVLLKAARIAEAKEKLCVQS